jgi:preprotein translocase subunit SecE
MALTNTAAALTNALPTVAHTAKTQSWLDQYLVLIIWAVVVGVIFAFLWQRGYLVKIRNFVGETREELKKCTWPSVDELKGSTLVIMVTIAILGAFTVGVDFILSNLIRWITS